MRIRGLTPPRRGVSSLPARPSIATLSSFRWLTGVGMAGSDRVGSGVPDRVHEFVDQFVRAYLSVNRKQPD